MNILKSIFPYFLKYKYRFWAGILFVITANFFAVLVPQFIGYIIDKAIGNIENADISAYNFVVRWMIEKIASWTGGSDIVIWASMSILSIAVLRACFMYFMRQTLVVMSRYIEYDQKSVLFDKYLSLDVAQYQKRSIGDFMTTIAEDVSRVRMMVGPVVMYICNILATSSFVIYYMLLKSSTLTIYVLIPLPFMAFFIYKVSATIHQRTSKVQHSLAHITSFARNIYTGIRVVKSFNQHEVLRHKFEQKARQHKAKNLKLSLVESIFMPSIGLIVGFSLIINVFVGGFYVIEGNLSLGTLTEFVIYLNLLVFPFSSLGWVSDLIQRASASQNRINSFLNLKSQLISGTKRVDFSRAIQFQNVSFTYPDKSKPAINKVSFTLQSKSKIGIVGQVGAGKTTLVDLCFRFFDPTDGRLLIDDVPLKDMDIVYWRKQVALVSQDIFLFAGTIADNIRFANPQLTDEQIRTLLSKVQLTQDIQSFPQKEHTIIGEKGVSLSGGQKQRLAIARAIAKAAPIVIFDDCFSAIDTHTEASIIKYMESSPTIETMIFISHRYDIMPKLDHIIVMDEGKIVETGTHQYLLAKKAHYYTLYNSNNVASSPI